MKQEKRKKIIHMKNQDYLEVHVIMKEEKTKTFYPYEKPRLFGSE